MEWVCNGLDYDSHLSLYQVITWTLVVLLSLDHQEQSSAKFNSTTIKYKQILIQSSFVNVVCILQTAMPKSQCIKHVTEQAVLFLYYIA